jgi:hypothetical protein
MKDKFIIVVVFAAVLLMCVLFVTMLPRHGTVAIDCRIAEISPDIPVWAKEECRKLRMVK